MTFITEWPDRTGAPLVGTYRLLGTSIEPRSSMSRIQIGDPTGQATCRVAMPLATLRQMLGQRARYVLVTGHISSPSPTEPRIDNSEVVGMDTPHQPSWQLLPRQWVAPGARDAFDRLRSLLGRLNPGPIRSFAHLLFVSQTVAEPFLSIPASRRHHHAEPGGLLIHSVQCAEVAESMSWLFLDDHEHDLAIIGALLHDICKIRILAGHDHPGQPIYGVSQEALNLEVLSPFLKKLDTDWPAGGANLREILAPAQHQGTKCGLSPLLLTDLIRYIDRLSSGADIRKQRFQGTPDWQRCAKTAQGALIKRVVPAATNGSANSPQIAGGT